MKMSGFTSAKAVGGRSVKEKGRRLREFVVGNFNASPMKSTNPRTKPMNEVAIARRLNTEM